MALFQDFSDLLYILYVLVLHRIHDGIWMDTGLLVPILASRLILSSVFFTGILPFLALFRSTIPDDQFLFLIEGAFLVDFLWDCILVPRKGFGKYDWKLVLICLYSYFPKFWGLWFTVLPPSIIEYLYMFLYKYGYYCGRLLCRWYYTGLSPPVNLKVVLVAKSKTPINQDDVFCIAKEVCGNMILYFPKSPNHYYAFAVQVPVLEKHPLLTSINYGYYLKRVDYGDYLKQLPLVGRFYGSWAVLYPEKVIPRNPTSAEVIKEAYLVLKKYLPKDLLSVMGKYLEDPSMYFDRYL